MIPALLRNTKSNFRAIATGTRSAIVDSAANTSSIAPELCGVNTFRLQQLPVLLPITYIRSISTSTSSASQWITTCTGTGTGSNRNYTDTMDVISNNMGYWYQPFNIAWRSDIQRRTYISRAHPKPRPDFALPDAINVLYQNIEERKVKRQKREDYHMKKATPEKPGRKLNHPNETIELAIMLNLDPRKPGQSLRGSITLPHGTGKKGQNVIVLTKDETICEAALKAGAYHAGGEAVIDQIVNGDIVVDSINSILGMPDIMPTLSKKAARILGPRGLMPNAKVGTIHHSIETLLSALDSAVAGREITYRTEKEGIIHVPIGKASFSTSHLLDNIGAIMKTIMDAKPDSYGKGKKKSSGKKGQAVSAKNQPKYLLRVTLSSTQSPGYRIDLRTIDPSSAFFLSTLDPIQASQKGLLGISDGDNNAEAASLTPSLPDENVNKMISMEQ
jgi:large subunit ribosomal protein L1